MPAILLPVCLLRNNFFDFNGEVNSACQCTIVCCCFHLNWYDSKKSQYKGDGKTGTAGALRCCGVTLTSSINSSRVTWMVVHCLLELCCLGKNKMASVNCIFYCICTHYLQRPFQGFLLRSLNQPCLKYKHIWNKNWEGCAQQGLFKKNTARSISWWGRIKP